MKHLCVEPGSVSLLAILNDTEHPVEVFIGAAFWASDAFQFHPMVNTSTLVLSKESIARFLSASNHGIRVVDVPAPQ